MGFWIGLWNVTEYTCYVCIIIQTIFQCLSWYYGKANIPTGDVDTNNIFGPILGSLKNVVENLNDPTPNNKKKQPTNVRRKL